MTSLAEKARALRDLHHGGEPIVFVNVWDVATAKLAEHAGCPAIATSSGGVAYTLGYPDGEAISRDVMIDMIARIARGVAVPVTADLESGYGQGVDDAAATARAAIEAGAVGLNIEDNAHRDGAMTDTAQQVARIKAMRAVGDALGVPLVVNARTDYFLIGGRDPRALLPDAIARGRAYAQAGADCIFLPGLNDAALIAEAVAAIPAPINILASALSPSLPELARLGVKRISLGTAPVGYALAAFRKAVEEVRGRGTFTFAGERVSYAEMAELMRAAPQ